MEILKEEALALLKEMDVQGCEKWNLSKLHKNFTKLVLNADDVNLLVETDDEDLLELIDDISKMEDDEELVFVEADGVADEEEDEEPEEEEVEEEDEPEDEEDEDEDEGVGAEDSDLDVPAEEDEVDDFVECNGEKFRVGDWVQVNNPQYPTIWVGQIKELQNDDYAEVKALDDRTWEERFDYFTPTKEPKRKRPKIKRLSREEVAVKVISEMEEPASVKVIVKRVDNAFISQGGRCSSNVKQITKAVQNMVDVLTAFGFASEDKNGFSLKKE